MSLASSKIGLAYPLFLQAPTTALHALLDHTLDLLVWTGECWEFIYVCIFLYILLSERERHYASSYRYIGKYVGWVDGMLKGSRVSCELFMHEHQVWVE